MTEQQLTPITPIRAVVSGYSAKWQVNLDETSTDTEILHALHEGCKEWSQNSKVGAALMLEVGKVLRAVKERGLHLQEPWKSLDAFLAAEVEERFGISVRTAYDALALAENLPRLDDKRAKAIGTRNLVLVAKAVKQAPPEKRAALRRDLLARAEESSVAEFQEHLTRRKLRQNRSESRLVQISFQVSREVADYFWNKIVGKRSASVVFSEWVTGQMKRKPAGRQLAVEVEHQQTA